MIWSWIARRVLPDGWWPRGVPTDIYGTVNITGLDFVWRDPHTYRDPDAIFNAAAVNRYVA